MDLHVNRLLEFLTELRANNNREWFAANKPRYTEIQTEFNAFAERLIERMTVMDTALAGITLRDCTYRIYRDTRFTSDKTPYKTHFGVYMCPHGKKSGYSGYYFHVEPVSDGGLLGRSILDVGQYRPEPKVLQSIREEILDNGGELRRKIADTERCGWLLGRDNALSRVPKGFPADSEYADLLRLRDVSLMKNIDLKYLMSADLIERVVADFAVCRPFNDILNRATRYAFEEM